MVISVTLNPCIDRTVSLKSLNVGGHNEAQGARNDISGKGINVAVACAHLGVDVRCLCLEHEFSGSAVRKALDAEGIAMEGVPVPGELRVNLKITETGSPRMTEINERGAPVPPGTDRRVLAQLGSMLSAGDILALSGSVPPGLSADIYSVMTGIAHAAGAKVLLDASGELLSHGIAAGPWTIKPNAYELEQLTGEKPCSREQAVKLCRGLCERGVERVCLSLGGDGALLVTNEAAWYSPVLDIPLRGFQGAGDSMAAGLCAAETLGLPPDEALRYGTAASQASLIREGTLLCSLDDFRAFLPQIAVYKL